VNEIFYAKLALNNIKKNSKTYFPYVLTCIGSIAMFYNMNYLASVKDIGYISDSESLRQILFFGAAVVGFFSFLFLFYTNSFLIKKRKKEFGIFNMLGMEKIHICRIMFYETIIISFISIVSGVFAGVLFSKLMTLLLLKIISFKVVFGFEIPISAISSTVMLFICIYILNFINNIRHVHLSSPIELLRGSNEGEKEPKTKFIMTVAGIICLSIGYYIALTTESPIEAINIFFIAVVLVIIGTYFIFIAGSITILKIMRNYKKYYYKTEHFISVSGMIYRMKRNAAGLANICILSTAVIVVLSTTVSLYVGVNDALRTRFPRDIIVSASNISDNQEKKIDALIEQYVYKANISLKNIIRYRFVDFTTIQNGERFVNYPINKSNPQQHGKMSVVVFITVDEYNKLQKENMSLTKNEVLLYTLRGYIPGETVDFNGYKLTIKQRLNSLGGIEGRMSAMLFNTYFFIADSIETINVVISRLKGNDEKLSTFSYFYGFDVGSDIDTQINLVTNLKSAISKLGINGYIEGSEIHRQSFYAIYGGLFFIGLFIGLLFIIATVLIIYYKQIAEGFDDRQRYGIMQKVGMSLEEVKKAIHTQIITVFFMPLIVAVIHIAFAFKVITKLLSLFNLTNVFLFAKSTLLTIITFAIFYTAVYMLTARTYYKIVSIPQDI